MSNMFHYLLRLIVTASLAFAIANCAYNNIDDSPSSFPYARPTMDNELQLGRILVIPQRFCHVKRNSELINSLLGLPKNMNNAGK